MKLEKFEIRQEIYNIFSDWGKKPYYKWEMYSKLLELIDKKTVTYNEVYIIGESLGFRKDIVQMRFNDLRNM